MTTTKDAKGRENKTLSVLLQLCGSHRDSVIRVRPCSRFCGTLPGMSFKFNKTPRVLVRFQVIPWMSPGPLSGA